MRLKSFVVSLALAVSPAVAAQGQVTASRTPAPGATRPSGVVDGIVSDTNLVPLQGAFVSILGSNIRVGTGPNGRFRIVRVPEGRHLIIVKRVGFRPTSGVVDVPADDTLRLSYMLDKLRPDELDPVVVTARSPSIRMAEFEGRRKVGIGEFMTEEQIAARNSVFPTELFRGFRSVNVSPSRTGAITQYFALSAREGGNPQLGACPMQVYVDQVPLPSPFNLDLLPPPKSIAGIEVYAGASTIPPQFAGSNRGCGVILVWTKDGGT
jgi:hypothetical protein